MISIAICICLCFIFEYGAMSESTRKTDFWSRVIQSHVVRFLRTEPHPRRFVRNARALTCFCVIFYSIRTRKRNFFSLCGSMSAIMAPSPSMRPAQYARSATEHLFPTALAFMDFDILKYITWDLRNRRSVD